MKRLFYLLLALTLLNIANCYGWGSYPCGNTWGQYFGFNSFPYADATQYFDNSVVRVYCNWELLTNSNTEFGQITLGTTYQNFKIDDYLQACAKKNVKVILCNKEGFTKKFGYGKWYPPVTDMNANRSDPNSYLLVSQMAFQEMARYGHNKNIDTSRINIMRYPVDWARPPKSNVIRVEKLVGLGLVDVFEDGNEEDRDWSCNVGACWTPAEFGAYLSAVVDGHKHTLGPNCGVWAADPTMPISVGGLCRFQKNGFVWIDAVKKWWQDNRGEPFPEWNGKTGIILSYHEYDPGPPESSTYNLRIHEKSFSTYSASHGNKFWIGEYGKSSLFISGNTKYMTQQYSKPGLIGKYSLEESLGIDLMKMGTMYFADTNVLYATVYEWKDQLVQVFNDMGGGVHKDNSQKQCYQMLKGFHNTLVPYQFSEVISESDPYIYELKNGTERAYVCWTASKDRINNYKPGEGDMTSAKQILPSSTGNIETLIIPAGREVIVPQIQQCPSIILVDADLNTPINSSPSLTVTSPTTSTFTAPASITFSANATDNDGTVAHVDFLNGSTLLFSDTQSPYTYTASNISAGTYTFKIVAYDNLGLSTSVNVPVTVNTPAPPPTGVYLTAPVNHQWKWSDGTFVHIIGHNSPETILLYLDYAFLDWLHQHGANTIYCAVNGKEPGHQVSPYKNNDPAQGFDDAKVNGWVAYMQYWCNLDPHNMVEPVLSEAETHDLYSTQQHKDVIQYLYGKFAVFNGRIITNREEVPVGWSKTNELYDYEKQVAPTWIRAMHCLTNQNPWSGNYGTDRIQVLSLQDNVSAFNQHMLNECPKNPNWICVASEMTGGFQPNDTLKAQTLWTAGGIYNCGVEVYVACCDQTDTHSLWYVPYAPVFDKLKRLLAGTTPTPTPSGPLVVEYSTSYSHTPSKIATSSVSIPSGSYWWFVRQGTSPVTLTLKKGTQLVKQTTDATPIYDLNGNSNVYFQSGVTYTLTAENAQGKTQVNITVQ